jgi:hypothetical protein
MSGWLSYFTGPRDTKQIARTAIVSIREQLAMLDKKEEYLEKKIEEEQKKAKANAVGNKAGTLPLLVSGWWRILLTMDCFSVVQLQLRHYGENERTSSRGTSSPGRG